MATWKSEFLAHYFEGRCHPLQHYAFGLMDKWARVASIAPSIANLTLRLPVVASLVKSALGVAPQRALPAFAPRSFTKSSITPESEPTAGSPVLLWADTWNNYFHPQALHSAASVLTAAGKSYRGIKSDSQANYASG